MTSVLRRLAVSKNERGASAVEYGLLVAAIAALIVVIVFALGGIVKSVFSSTCQGIGNGASVSTASCT
jgi:pilus assembly protein Flp/PilA